MTGLEEDLQEALASTKNSLWPEPEEEAPSVEQLRIWTFDSVVEATDGCRIEPDGVCSHGYPSWLIQLGLI